jgi:hypothetical protein
MIHDAWLFALQCLSARMQAWNYAPSVRCAGGFPVAVLVRADAGVEREKRD